MQTSVQSARSNLAAQHSTASNTSLLYATKADLASSTAALNAAFQSQLAAINTVSPSALAALQTEIAQTNRISQLPANIVVSGVSGLVAGDIPDLSSRYLPVSGGTISGSLTLADATSTNFFATTASSTNLFAQTASLGSLSLATPLSIGSGGTGWANINSGSILFGNGSSALATSSNLYWDNTSGRLGLATTSPDQALTVNGSIDISATGNYRQNNGTILNAFGVGLGNGADLCVGYLSCGTGLPNTDQETTAVGYRALGSFTGSDQEDTAVGWQSQYNETTAGFNVSVGVNTLGANVTSNNDVAVGNDAMRNSTTTANSIAIGSSAGRNSNAGFSVAIGTQALEGVDGGAALGARNIVIGYQSFQATTGSGGTSQIDSNIAIGDSIAVGATSANNNTIVGHAAGNALTSGVKNVFVGTLSGQSETSGTANTFVGYAAGKGATGNSNIYLGDCDTAACQSSITSGSQNIAIGIDAIVPSATANGQIDIGNVIYGTGLTGTGTNLSPASIGIGTTTPYSRLEVWGPDSGATTSAFLVANSASTTVFSVYDNGNATYAGSIFQSSDRRLKTNVATLTPASSLSALEQLNPVSYTRLDQQGSVQNLGFLAQQVGSVFPQLVSTSSATALTPDGTLTLNYEGLIAPIVSAIQMLSDTVNRFAESFTTKQLTFARASGDEVDVQTLKAAQELCIGSTCVTESQLQALLVAADQSSASSGSGASSSSSDDSSSTPPVLSINGDNPATIAVGGTYSDLSATITGPTQDLNLGIHVTVDGGATTTPDQISIDTSTTSTHTISYFATDQSGLTASATRTVIVQAASSTTQ